MIERIVLCMKTVRYILLSSLLFVAACGGTSGDDTADTLPSEPATEQASTKPTGPVIGQVIYEVEAQDEGSDLENSSRFAEAGAAANDAASRGVREIGWEELMPEGEEERLAQLYQSQMAMLYAGGPIAEGSAADTMVQIGTFNTVAELNETKVRLPGYTVPFEFGSNAEISEFLLVPQFGACIHTPPPPPNQTIFVMLEKPVKLKDLPQTVWLEGTIYSQIQESELADAAYTIKASLVEEYTY